MAQTTSQIAPRAGRCAYPTKTMRGKCWRKTYRYCWIPGTKKHLFLCGIHINKPIEPLL